MKKIIFCITLVVFCNFHCIGQGINDYSTTNYITLTVPEQYNGKIKYLNSNNIIETKNVNEVVHDSTILNSFSNLVSSVTVYQEELGGSLSLSGNSLSAKNTSYVIIYDFTQTQTIQNQDILNYSLLIGISVRMVAKVTTKKSGLNLANLFGLGLEASKKKVTGSLEVKTAGINSQKINQIIPVTSDFSNSSIANALQAVATIKSHIYDSETKITPQFLAFSAIGKKDDKFNFENISNSVKSLSL